MEDDEQFDREFYDMDEGGAVDVDRAQFFHPGEGAAGGTAGKLQEQLDAELTRRQIQKLSARRMQAMEDNNKWEERQLIDSGVVSRMKVDTDFSDDTEVRVHLVLHDAKPPFLDGRFVFTKLMDPVCPVRDPTSDMAVIARNGSLLVREVREKREREKSARSATQLAGTTLGDIMGIKKEENPDDQAPQPAESSDPVAGPQPKSISQYGAFADKKLEAQSQFAKTHTLSEQRKLLPIYGCRRDLLQIVSDNQVAVIVGATGSGNYNF